MPQAVKLSQENVNLIAHKIDKPVADVQAMYEHYKSTQDSAVYVLFDYTSRNTRIYYPWNIMREDEFRKNYLFPFDERPNKFMPIVSV